MCARAHPENEILGRFALGRLGGKAMARVEAHVRGCAECAQIAMRVPDDRLVKLLRTAIARPTTGLPRHKAADAT